MRPALPLALVLALAALPAAGAEDCTRDAMLVFDGSGSMAEMGFNDLPEPRIFAARRALHRAIPPIARNRNIGLLVYGPGGADQCTGIDLHFAPRPDAARPLLAAVDGLQPAGDTPLTESVRAAADLLAGPGDVVLVTDGKETCGGTPCLLAAELAARPGLTVHVIGFKVRGERFDWQSTGGGDYTDATSTAACLADRTGGTYVAAETVEDLVAALHATLGCDVIGALPGTHAPLRGERRF